MEVWKDVAGYEGVYAVSDLGNIKRTRRYETRPLRVLKSHLHKSGYLMISLWCDNRGRSHYVHRIVCEAFHGPANGMWCNHKDGVRVNNRASNLEWLTPLENERHAIRLLGKSNAGERNGRSKLARCDVRTMRDSYKNGMRTVKELVAMFSVSRRTVENIVKYRTWKHLD